MHQPELCRVDWSALKHLYVSKDEQKYYYRSCYEKGQEKIETKIFHLEETPKAKSRDMHQQQQIAEW